MAPREEVDRFVTDMVSEQVKSALDDPTKDALGGLIDYYESAGYSKESLAQSLDDRISSDLKSASADDVTKAVQELSAPQPSGQADRHVDEQPGDERGVTQQTSTPELSDAEVLKDLGEQAAWDAAAEVEANKATLMEDIVKMLWEDVRKQVEAEIKQQLATEDGGGWESDEQLKAALYEPTYNAMIAAIDELFETGEKEGGFAALLSRRPQ